MNYIRRHRTGTGFTLIELLIALTIIGILAAFAYPAYVSYINKAHRADALATLSQLQLTLERCYSQNFSYTATCSGLPNFPYNSPQKYYLITLSNLSATTYTLTATAQGAQLDDKDCISFSINQANVKTALDVYGTAQISCWTH